MRVALTLAVMALVSACSSEESGAPGAAGTGGATSGGGAGGTAGNGTGGFAGSSGGTGGGAGSGGGAAGLGGTAGSGGTAGAVDVSTATGKLLFGYQGWFACEGDGAPPNRWVHWFSQNTPDAQHLTVDMWPDVSELSASELFPTSLTLPGGKVAALYSAYTNATVVRHFAWMEDAGIDGVMLQRFVSELKDPAFLALRDKVAQNVMAGAEAHGRTFAIMYDISGANAATLVDDLKQDWAHLVNDLGVTSSARYQRHDNRPLLAIWGLGFSDRPGTPAEAAALVSYFQNTAQVTLMGGVPTHWRTLSDDSKTDPAWLFVYRSFDIVSPWSVGRYADDAGADNFAIGQIAVDLADAQTHGFDYMPVVWPGFSWKNLNGGPLNQIPRKGGTFWWRQVFNAVSKGSTMLYGAMFDEVDEGTAMFKIAPTSATVPAGASFVTLDADGQSLPSDWYLRLGGAGAKMLRGELPLSPTIPISP
ncbi:MAG: hypothetical protein KC776_16775 [Myxococcales bacterium]|nr:hypothetical protein [Myxococcales bacterium]MCB9575535.1 xylosidase/arabinosidase [Polyangiaceae bacterium]